MSGYFGTMPEYTLLAGESTSWLAPLFWARSTANAYCRSGQQSFTSPPPHRIPCCKREQLSPHAGCWDCLLSCSAYFTLSVFASSQPSSRNWMGFGYFWAALTGIAFFLSGIAICSGIMDVLAARLLALMLLLFEGFVEIPPIFVRLHNQRTWGAAVYNLAAIGACWIFAEFVASHADGRRTGPAEKVAMSRPDPVVA